ncbi:MAG: ABC transporter ATP-binding protein [Bacteroidia bacterium]|nr:ABC transporter ATP-binding protein [Bacteroidia bacterium]
MSPESLFNQCLEELKFLLKEKDYSRLSRRMMDLTVEFELPKVCSDISSKAREDYQLVQNDAQAAEAIALIEQLAAQYINEIEQNKEQIIGSAHSYYEPGTIVFNGNGISKRYTSGGSPFYLQPVDIHLRIGELTGVVGENGNGKTTLLRVIAGELSSDSGTMDFPLLGVRSTNWYGIKNQIAFIPQRLSRWRGSLIDNLRFYASIHGITGEENEKQVNYILNRLGLNRYRNLKWSEISSGYRLRFELAKMLMWRPKLLILDEPLANLDINAQQLLLQDLKYIAKSIKHPLSIILSSQNLHEVESVSDNIIFIKRGQTLYSGSQKQFGTERLVNNFELAGKFTREELIKAVTSIPGIKVEDSGTVFMIACPVEFSAEEFLNTLLLNGMKISYFRDISLSTRKLFQKDF